MAGDPLPLGRHPGRAVEAPADSPIFHSQPSASVPIVEGMTKTSPYRAAVARAAVALAMSALTGATAGLALARWPMTKASAS